MTTTGHEPLSDAQLDAALALLRPPPPSPELEGRVAAFAPHPYRAPPFRQRRMRMAMAAALLLAVGAGALLHVAVTGTEPPAARSGDRVAATAPVPSPAGRRDTAALPDEIRPPEIALVDAPSVRVPAESFSVAGLPLE